MLESFGGEANRGGGRKVELARVEELEERVLGKRAASLRATGAEKGRADLENLGPDLDPLEGTRSETTDD